MKNIIVISRPGEEDQIIDLTPVEEYEKKLLTNSDSPTFPIDLLDDIMKLDKDQMRYLINALSAKVANLNYMYHCSFKKDHMNFVKDIHKVRALAKKAGYDLWPELGEICDD